MAINIDKYRTDSKRKEPEKSSGSFNFEKYRSGTQENKAAEYGQYTDAMKSSRLMEIDSTNKRKEEDKVKQDAFNETIYGGTNKLKTTLKGDNKKEVKKVISDIQKVADQKTALNEMGMNSTKKVMADFNEETGRNLPVIGTALRGLDKFAEVTKPFADVAQELYTPGGSIGAINTASKSIGTALAKYVPRIGLGTGAGAKTVAKVIEGAPIGFIETAGQSLAHTQDLREAAKQGAYGAGIGAALPLAVPGGKWLVKSAREVLGGSRSGAVDSVVRDVPEATQAVRGAVDDVPVSSVPEQVKPTPENQVGVSQNISNSPKPITNATRQTTYTPQKDLARWIQTHMVGYGLYGGRAFTNVGDKTYSALYANLSTTLSKMDTMNPKPGELEIVAKAYDDLKDYVYSKGGQADFDSTGSFQGVEDRIGRVYSAQSNSVNPVVPAANPMASGSQSMVAAAQEPQPSIRERATVQNVRNNAGLSDELNARLDQSANKNYEVATDVAAAKKAIENTQDMTQAEANYLGNRSPEKEDIATAVLLMKKLGAQGKHEQAANIYDKLIVDLTRGGQTSQAGSLIGKLSPEGQLINLLRAAKANGKTVPVEDRVKFKDLAAKAQENAGAGIRENQFNDILNKMEKGENITVAEIKQLSDYLSGAEKVVTPSKVVDDLPTEFKDVKKREKIISFLDDAEQAALARIAARKNRLNALPLDEWADHAIVVSAQLARGTIKAATHVEDLVKLFGEEIRPVATQVFQKAQGLVKGVSRRAGEGDIERARAVLNRATGQTTAEKAIVEETARHVRKMIADAKAGNLDSADTQKLRDYSDEIADMLENNPKPKRLPTQEEKFLQSVKSLAKKIAQVESEKVPADQANREVSSLLRQVMKIADEGTPALQKQPIDNKALSDIAHDVMEKTRPNPKPTTLQEKIVEKYLKENPKVSQKDIDYLRDLAKNITRLSGDAKIDADIAMQKILNSYEKSSAWDKVQALRYMGMLLNTGTQAINALSGPIMATTGTVADVFGTMLDIALNKTLKTPRTTTLYGTNPLRFLAGYMKNLKTGAKAGFQGTNPAGIQGTNEIRGLAFKSLKNPLTFIPAVGERALGAVAKGPDFGTYKTIFNSEMVKQGFISAKNQGIKGKSNIDKHIREFVNDPPEEAILQADRIGKDSTFQRADRTGGKVANFLNTAPTLVKPGVNAIFPFVRTPINIASTAVTMTPAGIIKGLFQLTSKSDASRREAIRTLSMGVTGTGIGAVGYYLSQLGIITGANDSGDKDVDNIREQAGRGKYRFNTSALSRYLGAMLNGEGSEAAEKAAQYREGDKQFDYNKLQPLAFPLAAGASVGNSKDKPIGEKISNAGADSFGSLFGMSTLKGVQSVFQPSYGGTQGEKALGVPSRIAESFFKSFSPGGLAQEARRQDPIQRKTPFNDGPITNTTEYFKSRIPGLSQSLPSRKTTLGQDYKNAPGIKGSYLNPYRSEVAPYNKAAEIISGLIDRTGDLTLAPSAPEKTVKGKDSTGTSVSVAIPADRYAKLQKDVGNEIIKRITALSTSDDKTMATAIEDIYTEVRKEKMNEVKREFGIRVTR